MWCVKSSVRDALTFISLPRSRRRGIKGKTESLPPFLIHTPLGGAADLFTLPQLGGRSVQTRPGARWGHSNNGRLPPGSGHASFTLADTRSTFLFVVLFLRTSATYSGSTYGSGRFVSTRPGGISDSFVVTPDGVVRPETPLRTFQLQCFPF